VLKIDSGSTGVNVVSAMSPHVEHAICHTHSGDFPAFTPAKAGTPGKAGMRVLNCKQLIFVLQFLSCRMLGMM